MNNYELTTDEYCFMYKRYKKIFEWKHFKRKSWVYQQHLTEKYHIILIGHKTKKEKLISFSKKLTLINLNKGIEKFNKGTDKFLKTIEPTNENKDLSIPNYKEMSDLLGNNQKDLSIVWGKQQKQRDKEIKDLLGL